VLWLVGLLLVSFIATLIGTRLVLTAARKHALMDHPNERSSHTVPTPHGGGVAIIAVILPCWAFAAMNSMAFPPGEMVVVLAGAATLAIFSYIDDVRPLSPALRFGVQAMAVAAALWAMPGEGPFFGDLLPYWLDQAIALIGWLWFVNLYNFMDGIDGLSGSQTVAMALGIALLAAFGIVSADFLPLSLVLIGTCLGFLIWNWHPAKIFMGDVGSVPLGFLFGWVLLSLAQQGFFISALILALYYLGDATITLLRRAARGEKVWQPHREHFYQKAVQRGLRHDQATSAILLCNGLLIGLAYSAALGWPLPSLIAAIMTVSGTLIYLQGKGAS
jgi:UDP-N-acetylmuramyl pentapeptide phosphotransferase/UDP-N-acetylglucosamine-1-phosphate transferase